MWRNIILFCTVSTHYLSSPLPHHLPLPSTSPDTPDCLNWISPAPSLFSIPKTHWLVRICYGGSLPCHCEGFLWFIDLTSIQASLLAVTITLRVSCSFTVLTT
ncbi:hypothetical protein B0H65DRAFT_467169 [Neurospora tetraspora]|uniref:Uncharacterized protein n=1 Tax=Neurospora tetraspora TaxID=94610 RepID=A0AAE0MSU1_9PEZI|nr:hypothetical protein B0H65DRAFT_467169 [Neurospora tetraspora]